MPFIVGMTTPVTEADSGWIRDIWVTVLLVTWIISIIHAFMIRKEYLLRLEALQQRQSSTEAMLRRRLAAEYGEEVQRDETLSPISAPSATVQTAPERE